MHPETLAKAHVLTSPQWRARQAAHHERVDGWLGGHRSRRASGTAHPVEDFLFTYYSQKPAGLRRWHPGYGVVLEAEDGDAEDLRDGVPAELIDATGYRRGPRGLRVEEALLSSRHVLVSTLRRLLAATVNRPAQLGCLGLHEWAMVYQLEQDQVRHASWPLRLGSRGTDRVVETHRVACSHFDAVRFFTEPALAHNVLSPGREDRAEWEQPGCLHAGMDLYKHAFRLSPLVASELVADCFALAREIRVLDMRASPYDFSALGYAPVRIETPEGKAEYIAAQRDFAVRAAPLRARLLAECERLLAVLI